MGGASASVVRRCHGRGSATIAVFGRRPVIADQGFSPFLGFWRRLEPAGIPLRLACRFKEQAFHTTIGGNKRTGLIVMH